MDNGPLSCTLPLLLLSSPLVTTGRFCSVDNCQREVPVHVIFDIRESESQELTKSGRHVPVPLSDLSHAPAARLMKLLYDLALYLHSTSIPTFDGPYPYHPYPDHFPIAYRSHYPRPSSIRLQPLCQTIINPTLIQHCRKLGSCGSFSTTTKTTFRFATTSTTPAPIWRITHKPRHFGRIIHPLPSKLKLGQKTTSARTCD